jgi:hypothetical protein
MVAMDSRSHGTGHLPWEQTLSNLTVGQHNMVERARVYIHIWVQMSINHLYVYPDNFYKIQSGRLVQNPVSNFERFNRE